MRAILPERSRVVGAPARCGIGYARPAAIAWNVLGMLDFVVALITGVTYISPFVRQLATTGASTAYVNYVLIISRLRRSDHERVSH